MSHWVTVFKKNVRNCQKLSKTVKTVKNGQKWSVFECFWQFLTVFDSFWPFFSQTQWLSVTNIFFIKHSDSVWQTFFFLNTVTQSYKHLLNTVIFFLAVNLILEKNQKIWLPFKNKFQQRRKIGLEYILSINAMFREIRFTNLCLRGI